MGFFGDDFRDKQQFTDDHGLYVRPIASPGGLSAFGATMVAEEYIEVQLQFPYGIISERVYASGTLGGYVSSSLGRAFVQTGTGSFGAASIQSRAAARYIAGRGVRVKFAGIFGTPTLSSSQEVGIGDDLDGYFFAYSGSQFGVLRRSGGVDHFIPSGSWTHDRMDASRHPVANPGRSEMVLCPQSGNVYSIDYQWLGYGAIRFFVEDSETGDLTLVHIIKYANSNSVPSVSNPTLPLRFSARNWGNTTDVGIGISSMGAYAEGNGGTIGSRRGVNNLKNLGTSEFAVLSIMNTGTFNGVRNRSRLLLDYASFSNRGTAPSEFRILLNPSGAFSWIPLSASVTPAQADFAASTIVGGIELFTVNIAGSGDTTVDLSDYRVRVHPNDVVTVTVSGSTADQLVGLSWVEEF